MYVNARCLIGVAVVNEALPSNGPNEGVVMGLVVEPDSMAPGNPTVSLLVSVLEADEFLDGSTEMNPGGFSVWPLTDCFLLAEDPEEDDFPPSAEPPVPPSLPENN